MVSPTAAKKQLTLEEAARLVQRRLRELILNRRIDALPLNIQKEVLRFTLIQQAKNNFKKIFDNMTFENDLVENDLVRQRFIASNLEDWNWFCNRKLLIKHFPNLPEQTMDALCKYVHTFKHDFLKEVNDEYFMSLIYDYYPQRRRELLKLVKNPQALIHFFDALEEKAKAIRNQLYPNKKHLFTKNTRIKFTERTPFNRNRHNALKSQGVRRTPQEQEIRRALKSFRESPKSPRYTGLKIQQRAPFNKRRSSG